MPTVQRHAATSAMLQAFLRTATDGWTIALSQRPRPAGRGGPAPDEVGGDFAGEAERLGEATASVHADLAELFATQTLRRRQLRRAGAPR